MLYGDEYGVLSLSFWRLSELSSHMPITSRSPSICLSVDPAQKRTVMVGHIHIKLLVMYLANRFRVSRGFQRPKREIVKLVNVAGVGMRQPVNGLWKYPFLDLRALGSIKSFAHI
jgi:hypothetical protein